MCSGVNQSFANKPSAATAAVTRSAQSAAAVHSTEGPKAQFSISGWMNDECLSSHTHFAPTESTAPDLGQSQQVPVNQVSLAEEPELSPERNYCAAERAARSRASREGRLTPELRKRADYTESGTKEKSRPFFPSFRRFHVEPEQEERVSRRPRSRLVGWRSRADASSIREL